MRWHLLLLMAACVVPPCAIVAGLMAREYDAAKEKAYRDAVLIANSIEADLDRQVTGIKSGMRVLASSKELEAEDFRAFRERALAASGFQDVDNYLITDRDGRQRVNTLRPTLDNLPTSGTPGEIDEVFETALPVVTGLFNGPVTGTPVLAIGVPVFRQGKVAYSLNVGISPSRVSQVVRGQVLPIGWVAAVLDRHGTIIGRSRDEQQFVGKPAVLALREAAARDTEGTLETLTKDGIPVFTAFSRSTVSGWVVAVGAPRASVLGNVRTEFIGIGVLAMLFIGASSFAALRIARRISRAVEGLIAPALALGSARSIDLPPSSVAEVEAVGAALTQAGITLETTRQQALHDSLTGLGNRLSFLDAGARLVAAGHRSGAPLGLIAIDLDRFKAVNDRLGHAAGDLVLKIAAERINLAVRSSDVVARLGGDEFVVLLATTDEEGARGVAQKITSALGQPYPDVVVRVAGSAGLVMLRAGEDLTSLMARADAALYRAKGLKTGEFSVGT